MSNRQSMWALTPVKRSHLVSTSGVGSIVRLRNGATALVADLRSWMDMLPISGAQNQASFLREYTVRDPELEAACGVSRFLEPPRAPDEDHPYGGGEWNVPAVVFPRTGICRNFRCESVALSVRDTGTLAECMKCDPVTTGRRKTRYRQEQSPIFLVCPKGHIDEVDWANAVVHADGCASDDIRVSTGASVRTPTVKCAGCGVKQTLTKEHPCTGARPWIPWASPETCEAIMQVVDRTSVQTYFAQTKSSIHVPAKSGLDAGALDWILLNIQLQFVSPDDDSDMDGVREMLLAGGITMDIEKVRLHVAHLKSQDDQDEEAVGWDMLAARAHELDVLTGANPMFRNTDSTFLEFTDSDLSGLDPRMFGPQGLIGQVVAITRLTETRVQDGFSRWEPGNVGPDEGHRLLWGSHRAKKSWLPAYRAYGEGILFVLNPAVLDTWSKVAGLGDTRTDAGNPDALSYRGVLAHCLAHSVMKQVSQDCGYPLPSITDRIYDLPDGRTAFLVFTAESDVLGTLGGLVEYSSADRLGGLLRGATMDLEWCSHDPVCISHVVDPSFRQAAACHQCLLVPETSCEWMNRYLDRATVVGSKDRAIRGVMSVV